MLPSDLEARDLDETRRLALAAIAGCSTAKGVTAEMAGTIVNAAVFHSETLSADEDLEQLLGDIVAGEYNASDTLWSIVWNCTEKLSQ